MIQISTFLGDRLQSGSPYAIGPLSVCPVCDVPALWPNGWTDQDETWHAGRPRPWPNCVRWGPSSPSPKGAQPLPPILGPYLLRPNGCMDQDVTWYRGRPRPWPGGIVLDPALPKRGSSSLNLLLNQLVKEFRKSISIWQSYRRMYSGTFFWMWCTVYAHSTPYMVYSIRIHYTGKKRATITLPNAKKNYWICMKYE